MNTIWKIDLPDRNINKLSDRQKWSIRAFDRKWNPATEVDSFKEHTILVT